MPPGKQAAAYTLASSFAMVVAKCRMLLPTPFQFSSPQLYLLVLLLLTLLPPFFFGGSFCVSHSLRDCGEEQGRPSAKMRRCITGKSAHAVGKISRVFRVVPPLLRAVWESPWGSDFHAIWNIKHYSHFFPRWELLCFPFPAGLGGEQGRPSAKIRRCITGESALAGEKSSALSRLSRHRSGQFGKALGVWLFYAIRNLKHCSHLFSLRRGRE